MRSLSWRCLQLPVYVFAVSTLLFQVNAQSAKPSLRGTDLLCNGESFFAASNINSELTRLAQEDGVLPANESFQQVAVSGVPISTVLNQFKNADPKPKYVVTDGGGIDLMQNNCNEGDVNCQMIQQLKSTLEEYIEEMRRSGVKAFIWMCYPDPQGAMWANLKKGQDIWAVVAKEVVENTTDPKPLWVDLRETWEGHYNEYTSDGIHCTDAGGAATAQAFWNAMKADNYAFFDTATTGTIQPRAATAQRSIFQGQVVKNGNISIMLDLNRRSDMTVHLTNVSGRTILTARRQGLPGGAQTVQFPLGVIAPGVYCLDVEVGRMTQQSTMIVP